MRKKKERGVKTNSRDSSKGSTSRSSVGKRQYKKAKIPLASHAGTLYLKHERLDQFISIITILSAKQTNL